MTIPCIDALFEGFSKANEESSEASDGNSKTLTNADALGFLMNNPM